MNVLPLLERARDLGIDLEVSHGEIRFVQAPSGAEPLVRLLQAYSSEVLAVLVGGPQVSSAEPDREERLVLPFIDGNGDLHVPLNAPQRFRWWAGGQSIAATLDELGASEEVRRRYTWGP